MAKTKDDQRLEDAEVRKLFKAMHSPKASTRKLASTGRANKAKPYKGDHFVEEFEGMIDEHFKVASEAMKKFGS